MKVYSTEITGFICSVCGDDTDADTYQGIANDYHEPACKVCMQEDLESVRVNDGEEAYQELLAELKNYPMDYLPERYQVESPDLDTILSDWADARRED